AVPAEDGGGGTGCARGDAAVDRRSSTAGASGATASVAPAGWRADPMAGSGASGPYRRAARSRPSNTVPIAHWIQPATSTPTITASSTGRKNDQGAASPRNRLLMPCPPASAPAGTLDHVARLDSSRPGP